VDRRQVFVAVPEMILTELTRRVTKWLQKLSESHVSRLQTRRRAGQSDFAQAGAQSALAGDERRAAGRAALFGVIVGEHHTFLGDAIDIRRTIAHPAHRVGADISLPDVIAEDDEDVRFLSGRWHW